MQWNQSSSVRSNSISHLSSVPSSTNTKRSQKSEDESMFDDGDFNSTCSEEVSFHHGLSPHCTDVSSSHTEVFLSLVWHSNKLGVAFYDLESPQINFMVDSSEMEDFVLLKQVLKQIQPTFIVLSSKQDERLLKVLKQTVNQNGEQTDTTENWLQFLPSSDFSLEISKRRILSLNLPGLPSHSTETERILYFSSVLPMDAFCMVKAVGGLLKYLDQTRIGVELEDAHVKVPVLGFRVFTVEDQVIMDDATYSALQIFHKEAHPSVYKIGTPRSCKEGLSLFGILNKCKSQIGSKKLRLWFLRPLKNVIALRNRLQAITFFIQPQNMEITSSLQTCLKSIKNAPRILSRMVEAQAGPSEWMALYKTVYHAVYIGDICRSQTPQVEIFIKIARTFTNDLHKIANLISKTVDLDESATSNRFVVKSGLDEVLDEKKRLYYGLPDLMTKVAREELARLGDHIKACNVIYMPQICYLLAIPKDERLVNEEDYEMPGLQFMGNQYPLRMVDALFLKIILLLEKNAIEEVKDHTSPYAFESNGVLHYKSSTTKELDNMLGDTLCDIKDTCKLFVQCDPYCKPTSCSSFYAQLKKKQSVPMVKEKLAALDCGKMVCPIFHHTDIEISIMHKLQNAIIQHSYVLFDVMEYAAELDCLMALATCAQEFGYVCPELTEESIIDVKKGRHPLQELCCSPYVPNNIQSGGPNAKVKVLTGPNACGKSVYLKQVGLIVFMAHIGSYVPAQHAVIGQVDRIFSRIKSMESISVGLSTFMLDINQMADALNNATAQSLVLVDEFGKGTETIDGLSLLCASLRYWLKKGACCPHVLVSTHFHSLVQEPVLPSSPLLEFLTMETLQEGGELVFLFHLTDGHTSSSYAAYTALQAGLPTDVVQRGKEVSNLLCQYLPVHQVDDNSTETQLKRCEKIVKKFLLLDLEKDDVQGFLQNFVLPTNNGQNIA